MLEFVSEIIISFSVSSKILKPDCNVVTLNSSFKNNKLRLSMMPDQHNLNYFTYVHKAMADNHKRGP